MSENISLAPTKMSLQAPSRRLLAQFKSQLNYPPNARWKTVLAPYLNVSDTTPDQLRSKARELALMSPAELTQVKRARQRQERAERRANRQPDSEVAIERQQRLAERKRQRQTVTFKLVYRYELLSKGEGNTERWVQKTLDLMDHPELHNEPLRDRRQDAHKHLTEETFWANLRIAYPHIDAGHVRLDLANSYVEFSEHDVFRTLAVEPEDQLMRSASVLKPDWLKYADHIDQMALQEADEKYGCVPTQLTEALLNNRRPIKWLPNGAEVSLENVKIELDRIKGDATGADPGYSSRHVGNLLRRIGLTYYAYDANNKCFKHEVGHLADGCHHSPLAWYATQGHMYLLTKEANNAVRAEQQGGGRPKAVAEGEKEERPVTFVTSDEARAAFEAVDDLRR